MQENLFKIEAHKKRQFYVLDHAIKNRELFDDHLYGVLPLKFMLTWAGCDYFFYLNYFFILKSLKFILFSS